MQLIEEIAASIVRPLCESMDRLSAALGSGIKQVPITTAPPLESKRGRGRPPKEETAAPPQTSTFSGSVVEIVADSPGIEDFRGSLADHVAGRTVPLDVALTQPPPTGEAPDYDSLLTQIRAYGVRVLDADAKAKNRVNREKVKEHYKVLNPEGPRWILSEMPQERYPEILTWFKATWPALEVQS